MLVGAVEVHDGQLTILVAKLPVVEAHVRDMAAVGRDDRRGIGAVPTGQGDRCAAIDGDATWIVPLASYLSCDPSGSNSGNDVIDIFGLNN